MDFCYRSLRFRLEWVSLQSVMWNCLSARNVQLTSFRCLTTIEEQVLLPTQFKTRLSLASKTLVSIQASGTESTQQAWSSRLWSRGIGQFKTSAYAVSKTETFHCLVSCRKAAARMKQLSAHTLHSFLMVAYLPHSCKSAILASILTRIGLMEDWAKMKGSWWRGVYFLTGRTTS